jgi:hypothetical protein
MSLERSACRLGAVKDCGAPELGNLVRKVQAFLALRGLNMR